MLPKQKQSKAPPRNFFIGDVRLTWQGVSWATRYRIQVARDILFNGSLDADATVEADTSEIELPTLTAGTYYWRVQAEKTNGTWSVWSVVENFTVGS